MKMRIMIVLLILHVTAIWLGFGCASKFRSTTEPPPAPEAAPPPAAPEPESQIEGPGKIATGKLLYDPYAEEVGWMFLVGNQQESGQFGMYSYILFGAPPTDETREQYLTMIRAFIEIMSKVEELMPALTPNEINVTYIPVKVDLTVDSAELILQQYNYVRARALLRQYSGTRQTLDDGPYLISCLRPLDSGNCNDWNVFQDLSAVPPVLVDLWIKTFRTKTTTRASWSRNALTDLTLTLRTEIAIWSQGLLTVKEALVKAGLPKLETILNDRIRLRAPR